MSTAIRRDLRAPETGAARVASHLAGGGAIVVGTWLVVRFYRCIARFAVNTLYWDQWDFLGDLFAGRGVVALFLHQHGPQREGLAAPFLSVVYGLSGWNTRVEAFASGTLVVLGALVAIVLKRRLVGRLEAADVAIAGIYLTLAQFELFVGTQNPSHGPFPALLVPAIGLALSARAPAVRAAAGSALGVCAISTGFAWTAAGPLGLVLALQAGRAKTARDRIVLTGGALFVVAMLAVFLATLRPEPAADCFRFPHDRPLEYVTFAAVQLGRAAYLYDASRGWAGIASGAFVCAAAVLGALVVVFATSVRRLARGDDGQRDGVLTFLSGATLAFLAATAVGRVCLGVEAATSSRYVPYAFAGLLALHVSSGTVTNARRRRFLVAAFAILMVAKELRASGDRRAMNRYRDGKTRWVACYVRRGDVAACDREAKFALYPAPAATALDVKLEFLRVRRLSFFRER